ncbi:APC family permease [Vibrio ezurae]|uniref:Putative serine/threonine exchanger transporter n=1 Tax=Vibrio ezurae NBRC 102218 TaxID=1219080 RepID=U3CP67_9VIBR|nr:APC family permease [Vibrio ezurae]GAD79933.1 putative serine/threonine exchanger transporter [Vibrio ezurae NBRC 102218]
MHEKLQPKYGLGTAVSLVVGIVVGIGIFFKTGPVLSATGGNGTYAVIAWVLAAVLTTIAAMVISEIASMGSKTGGLMSFSETAWGERFGFFVGWVQTVIYIPLILAVILYYSAVFTCAFLQVDPTTPLLASLCAIYFIVIAGANLLAESLGGFLQRAATIIKLIPLLSIAVFGFFYQGDAVVASADAVASVTEVSFGVAIAAALIPVLFALDGWIYVTTIAHEIKNPQRNLPLAMVGGLVIIGLVYVTFTLGLLSVAQGPAYVNGEMGVSQVANLLFGEGLGRTLSLFIVISALGGFNGLMLLGMRMPYSLAMRRNFAGSQALLSVSPKTNLPVRSGVTMLAVLATYMIVGFVLVTTGIEKNIFDLYGDLPIALMWIIYASLFIGVWRLRVTQPNAQRLIRVPALPLFVIVAICGTGYALYGFIPSHVTSFALSCLIAVLGFLVYAKSTPRTN